MACTVVACTALAVGAAAPASASSDPVNGLANAICGAADLNGISTAMSAVPADDPLAPEQVAEAFGIAAFLADLGRCTNRQAIADGFAIYKKDKEVARLDTAFATGRVAAKPESSGQVTSSEVFQGSFASLGTAGDPPSGQ
jgi:hypothetical protein